MRVGLKEKFKDAYLRKFLANTGNKIICECSFDQYYGCGFSLSMFEKQVKLPWKGKNNLGLLLMDLRKSFSGQ